MNWPFRTKKNRPMKSRLDELEEMFDYFQNLEKEYRTELEESRREEDRARSLDDEVNREMFRKRIELLTTFLNAIAKIKFVIDQVRYTVRLQEGMGRYSELQKTLEGVDVSTDLRQALDKIHQDLELIRKSSNVSVDKIDGYFETLRPAPSTSPPAANQSRFVPSGRQTNSAGQEAPDVDGPDPEEELEKRVRRRLEES